MNLTLFDFPDQQDWREKTTITKKVPVKEHHFWAFTPTSLLLTYLPRFPACYPAIKLEILEKEIGWMRHAWEAKVVLSGHNIFSRIFKPYFHASSCLRAAFICESAALRPPEASSSRWFSLGMSLNLPAATSARTKDQCVCEKKKKMQAQFSVSHPPFLMKDGLELGAINCISTATIKPHDMRAVASPSPLIAH